MISTVAFVVALIGASSMEELGTKSQSACENIVGMWEGENTYEDSGIHSKYRADHKADGTLTVSIEVLEPGKPPRVEMQRGLWRCEGDVFSTLTVNNLGEEALYQYRLLEMRPNYLKYQNFSGEQLGPVFEANRVWE